MREVEAAYDGKPLENILRTLYYDEQMTQAEVAKVLGIPPGTLATWMIRLGINQQALAGAKAAELAL